MFSMEWFRLDGQNAFVTGAGSGIGQGIAIGLAQAGANVACFDVSASAGLPATVNHIQGLGRHAVPTRCATRSTLVKQATSGTKTVRTSVYFCVGMLVFQTRPVKGAESYVAEIRDLIILAMFVLPQAEGPGRAVAGRTSRCLHLQHLCRLLSTGHAERAREAASSPSLLNVA